MASSVRTSIRKVLRTVQSVFPGLRAVKQTFYDVYRGVTAQPHDGDFRALRLLDATAPGVYLDVGANHGQSIESIRLFRPDAQIVAFEPNPYLAAKLAKRYAGRASVEIRAIGLSEAEGEMTLFVPSYHGFVYDGLASLDRDEAMNWIGPETVFFFDPAKLTAEEFRCPISTLDQQRLEPAFLKIDVQGYEYHALKGAVETLARCEPIVLIENYNGDARSVALMSGLGYREYYFDGKSVVPGRSQGANSFLITAKRASAEGL